MKQVSYRIFIILFFLFLRGGAFSADGEINTPAIEADSGNVAAAPHLFSPVSEVQGGEAFEIDLLFELAPGWHLYWRYPGDVGVPPRVEWTLPEGWSARELEFSLPEKFVEPDGVGSMVVYGYKHMAFLRTRITPPAHLIKKTSWSIRASVSWLVCKDLCVPGKSMLTLNLPSHLSLQDQDAANRRIASACWPSPGGPPFPISISHEGENNLIAFQGRKGCSYELFPIPEVGQIVGHVTTSQEGENYKMKVPWKGTGGFHGLLVEQEMTHVRRGWFLPAHAQSIVPSLISTLSPPSGRWSSWWLSFFVALISGLIGGCILNVMPCVLPVISLKIFGFIQQAGSSRSHVLRHGLSFVAGIYLWFLSLGALIVILKASGREVTWAFQFQNPIFLLVVSLVVFLFALNLFGLFEITLPVKTTTSLDLLASRSGYAGSFFQGLFATLLATPCTAPFLGSALGFAFAQSGIVIMTMFAAIATGMALPYILLSVEPAWMKWLPHPGVWMERVKVLMGFPLLATNLWLLSIIGVQQGFKPVMALLTLFLSLGLAAWIYGAYYSSKTSVRYVACSLSLLIALTSISYLVPKIVGSPHISSLTQEETSFSEDQIHWVPFSRALLDQLRGEGKAVFVDFTAAWCLTCQFNEHRVLRSAKVRAVMEAQRIVAMKADWTNANPEITEALQRFGRVGVPFYVFYPGNQSGTQQEPVTFSELLSESQLVNAFLK